MARGISSKWKQPIFVDFDTKMTKTILFDIIDKLNEIGFRVICCVSDCGGGNVGLWKELEVNYENPIFYTPNGQSVACVPDAPHLLKLVRNWFLDTGFNLNGNEINKRPIEALMSKITTEVNVCHKLTSMHLTCEGPQRQNVKLAAQLLSHNTASALTRYQLIKDTKLNNNTANFIELINNWFDLVNVAHSHNCRTPFTSPYGTFLEEQNSLLNEVYEIISKMRCVGKNSLQIFQKGILMHINSTRHLLNVLKQNRLTYLLTSKINQDALENLYSQLRTRGGLNDHPSPLNAIYRLRMIILGKNPGITSNHCNTTDDNKEEFMVAKTLKLVNINLGDEHISEDEIGSDTDTSSESGSQLCNQDTNKVEIDNDAVEYLAGWVAKKHRSNIPEIGSTTDQVNKNIINTLGHDYEIPSWINHVSYGGLIVPSSEFKKIIFRVERLFNKFTNKTIPKGPNIVKHLTNKILCRMDTEEKWKPSIRTYVKQRILIRMKYFNQNALILKNRNKAKMQLKKLTKLKKVMT